MGLSNFPSAAEGVLPVLVMNTVMSVAILKNLLKSFLELMGAAAWISSNFEEDPTSVTGAEFYPPNSSSRRRNMRGIRITQFKYLCVRERKSKSTNFALGGAGGRTAVECCVCLCKFGEEEEVSELSCKHFFHKKCLDKWFDNHHSTCPLCRSIH